MSLPAETKFPCMFMPEFDSLVVSLNERHLVVFRCIDAGQSYFSYLDREQVESLRDQVTEWLEVTK